MNSFARSAYCRNVADLASRRARNVVAPVRKDFPSIRTAVERRPRLSATRRIIASGLRFQSTTTEGESGFAVSSGVHYGLSGCATDDDSIANKPPNCGDTR